jgi:parallel beta-helix repeat protein
VYARNAQATIRDCTIYDCYRGIEIAYGTGNPAEGEPVVEYCEIRGNAHVGVYVYDAIHDAVHIERNTIRGNGGLGIYSSGSSMQIINNTIAFNSSPGGIDIRDGSAVIRNNIITDNEGYGIFCAGTAPDVTYNDVWNNSVLDYNGCSGGAGSISEDPIYCDAAAGDVSVHAGSPTVGAGENGVNMGALGVGCPEGPQGLAVAQNGASLEVSWSAPPWARTYVDHYVVYRDTTLVPETVIATVDAPDTVFIDITTPPCETYNYWVSAVDSDTLEGALSNRATGEICYEGPGGLSAVFNEGANELSWSRGSGPIDYYVIQRGNEVVSPDSIGWVLASDTTFVDTAVAECPRDNYGYEIAPVYDTGWRGEHSELVSVDPAPSPPSGVIAEWVGSDIQLTWEPNCESDFRRYWVYRDTLPISPPIDGDLLVGFTPDPELLDEGLNPSWTYFYRLVATDAESQRSEYSVMVIMGTGDILAVPSPYGTIQAAIDAASAIDTVLVSPGTYNENITMKNGVIVMSTDGRATTTISSGSGAVVTSVGLGDLTLLDGFTIDGQGTAQYGLDSWVSYLRVEDCSFVNSSTGANLRYGDNSTLTANSFTSNVNGIAVADSSRPFLRSNVIELNTFAGIYNAGEPGPEVGRTLGDANDIMDNALFQVFNTSSVAVDADYNYWGSTCVGDSLFYGLVDYVPWTDETHTETYTECGTGVDGPAVGKPYLSYNFPNPFNPTTAIQYRVPSPGGRVRLSVYDLSGRTVRTLVDAYRSGGEHLAVWRGLDDHGREVGSGVYFYRLEVGDTSIERNMVMLKYERAARSGWHPGGGRRIRPCPRPDIPRSLRGSPRGGPFSVVTRSH